MIVSLIDQAIQFLSERGWPIIPSTGPQKGPCVGWKQFQVQVPTVDQLLQWNRKLKPDRWGVVTGKHSGIVVVDFDGEQGTRQMRQWGINPHLRTGSGGFHWYGIHPGWRVPTLNAKTGKLSWPWPGVDIRGDGGFAILLGRNSNGSYVQLRDLIPEPFDTLPQDLRNFLRKHSEGVTATQQVISMPRRSSTQAGRVHADRLIEKTLPMAAQDGRNNGGFWLACQLRDNGFSPTEAEAALRDYRARVASTNAKGKAEPYTENETAASLREAYSRPPRSPWEKKNPRPHDATDTSTTAGRKSAARDLADSSSRKERTDDAIANGLSNLNLYVVQPCEPLVGHTGEPLPQSRFVRIPTEVSTDRQLKPLDVRVYGVLAGSCWSGGVSSLGKRLIAVQARCAERLVIESLKRLAAAGHIRKQPVARGQRGKYSLLSPVFAENKRSNADSRILPVALPRKSVQPALTAGSGLHAMPKAPKSREGAQ